jgi:hypothetical protein
MQFIVAGGLTAVVNALTTDLSPEALGILTGAVLFATTYAQNWLEDRGYVPAILKPTPTESTL